MDGCRPRLAASPAARRLVPTRHRHRLRWSRALGLALLAPHGVRAEALGEDFSEALPDALSGEPDTADFLRRLNTNFRAIQEELRELRAEQRELRSRLSACGCGSGGAGAGAGEAADEDEAEESSPAALSEEASEGRDWGPLVAVDVANTGWLKEVLFGGEPWVLHCVDGRESTPVEQQLPAIFNEAALQLKSMASFGLLDCWQRTASGKTLAHRFDFPKPPVTFAVANGDSPSLVDLEGMTKPWQLRRKLQGLLQASVARIADPKSFKSFCTSRRACLVVGYKAARVFASALRMLNPVLERHRGVRAVAVDTSVWKVRLDKSLAATKPKRKGKQPKEQAEMLCISRPAAGSWQGAWLRGSGDEELTEEALGSFLERCSKGSSMLAMAGPPSIAQRPPEQPRVRAPSPAPAGAPGSAGKRKGPPSPSARPSSGRPGAGRGGRAMPRYSSARGGGGSRADARKDHVGSRSTLEEDEPLFSAVEEEPGDGSGGGDAEDEVDGDDVEEVEL